jgi:NADPH-dependent ferric siderophore reductase
METSTLELIKGKVGRLFESQLQSGYVLEVRTWEPATIVEVDLHLPYADMDLWTELPYIKIKVAELTYRDYSPSCWDAETQTCTLFIDAAHTGPGSSWAKRIKKGDIVSYIKTGSTHHAPEGTAAIIGLGDESSVGHLLALQQMVLPRTRFTGAVLMANESHCGLFNEYFRSPLQPVNRNDVYGHHTLIQWVIEQQYALDNTIFYLTGNQVMVAQLRKLLRHQGYSSAQVRAQGFWR